MNVTYEIVHMGNVEKLVNMGLGVAAVPGSSDFVLPQSESTMWLRVELDGPMQYCFCYRKSNTKRPVLEFTRFLSDELARD